MAAREAEGGGTGSACRRWERRLRAYLKYARMSVAMALTECQHHSTPRGQRKARAREEDPEVHYTATVRATDPPPEPVLFDLFEEPGGVRPHLLVEPQGAQARLARHRVARHRVAQVFDVPVLFELPLIENVDRIQQRPDDHAVHIPFSQVVVEPSEVHVPLAIPQEQISEQIPEQSVHGPGLQGTPQPQPPQPPQPSQHTTTHHNTPHHNTTQQHTTHHTPHTTHNTQHNNNTTNKVFVLKRALSCGAFSPNPSGRPMAARDAGTSAAKRRRERRLRSWWRQERMSIAAALAEALHHSSGTRPSKYDTRVVEDSQHGAVRGQTTATRAVVPGTQYFTFDDEDVLAPQERVLQRIEVYVDAPSLDVPALQWDEEANAFLLAPLLHSQEQNSRSSSCLSGDACLAAFGR